MKNLWSKYLSWSTWQRSGFCVFVILLFWAQTPVVLLCDYKITPLLCNVLSLFFPPFFVLLLKRTSRLHPPFHLLLYATPEILKRLMQWAKVTTAVDIFLEQCVATVGSDSLFHSLRLSRTNVIWPLLKIFLTYEVLWIEGMSLSTEWRRNLICETAVN